MESIPMGETKHLVVAKFKEGVAVEEIIKGMEKMVSEVDSVLSFEWGKDVQSQEMLRQGFTHAFLMAFRNQEEFTSFLVHPKHVEFSATFSTAIEKVVLLDFPSVVVKPNIDQNKPIEGKGEGEGAAAPAGPPAPAPKSEPPPAQAGDPPAAEAPSQPAA